jgi:hypothetical protein
MLPWILGGVVGTWLGYALFRTALAALTFAVLGGAVGSAIAKSRVLGGERRGDAGGSGDGGDFAWSDGGASCDSSDGGGDGGGCD